MKKNKFLYMLSAFALACIISFSGFGSTYIQANATSVGIERPVWNDEESVWDNILMHLRLYMSFSGVFTNPSAILFNAQDFYDFMISDGVSHDTAHGVFCDCDDETHTSFSGQEHGGGGFVCDGISVDDDGNVTYSDDVSDLFHDYIKNYLDTNSGYSLFKTSILSEVPVSFFTDKTHYDNFVATVNYFDIVFVSYIGSSKYMNIGYIPYDNVYVSQNPNTWQWCVPNENVQYLGYANGDSTTWLEFYVIEDDWSLHKPYEFEVNDSFQIYTSQSYTFDDLVLSSGKVSSSYLHYISYKFKNYGAIFSKDGRNIKVWYDLDAFKNYDIGHQMYYVTDSFNNYDSTIDNSTTITSQEFAYYNDNSTTIYQTIQNNIDNSGNSDLTEKDVQDIVDNAVQEIKDSIANSGNDNGGSDSGDSDGGSGVGDLVDGIGKLLDTILSLIGKVMGVVADFTQSILDLFSGFTEFTDGFSNFLSGAFGFIPQEIWNVIQVGLSLMILLAVIKFLRK